MTDADKLLLLRQDLQRTGTILGPGEDLYLKQLLFAAQASLERQGALPDGTADYDQMVISTAAWMYRKRITGEAEPQFLRRMRLDCIISQRGRGGPNAP